MKVVLFCGGLGLRLRDYGQAVPKPMVPIGQRPILWHVMRYYAHFGYKEFVLCLGYKADVVKEYFLRYNEALSNDFVLSEGGRSIELLRTDIQDWRITFADTGLHSNIAQRLCAVRRHVEHEEIFLANYADVLTDAPMATLVDAFRNRDADAAFLSVRPVQTFHIVASDESGHVSSIDHVHRSRIRINGGHFILRPSIFDYINPGDELVEEPFERLIRIRRLVTYPHEGFWAPMDTLKDLQILEDLYQTGQPPWALWHRTEQP